MNMEEAHKELAAFLNDTKALDVDVPHDKVIEVSVDMTPTEAAKLLWENKVIGAPVWDQKHNKYIGFFDMRDLISTVIASHKEEVAKLQGASHNHNNSNHKQEFAFTKWFLKETKQTTCGNAFTVSYLAARNPFVSVTPDATLMQVCRICANRHCHRVPIVDPTTGRCIRILSQSALVKFLVQHLLDDHTTVQEEKKKSEHVQQFFHRSLQDANFPYKKPVKSMLDTATAEQVFELMDENRLSGIAIVSEEDGALVGNTSASDIKLAVAVDDEGPLADLGLNIMSYLSAVRQEDPTKEAKYPSAHVRESSTLAHAVKLLAKTGYHRVFVTDSELKPVGVVSVTDVVDFLAQQ